MYDTPTNLIKRRSLTLLHKIHLMPPLLLNLDHFRLRNPLSTLFYSLSRALFTNQLLMLVHVLPKTTTLLKIWLKHCMLCLLLKFYNTAQVNIECSWPPSTPLILSRHIISRLTLTTSSHDFLTSLLFKLM